MNQNISKESYTKDEETKQAHGSQEFNDKLKDLFSIRNIIIYILTLFISMAGSNLGMKLFFAPLGFSMGVAAVSFGIPSILVIISSLIGTLIKNGINPTISMIVAYVILLLLIIITRPKRSDLTNEKIRLGRYTLLSIFITYIIFGRFNGIGIQEAFIVAFLAYSFYKIFVNSFPFFNDLPASQALTNEEVVSASVAITIAISTISSYGFWAFYLSNFLCIALILFIGWRYGYFSGLLSGLFSGLAISLFANINIYLGLIYGATGFIIGIYKKLNFDTIPSWAKPTKMLPVASGQIEEGTDELLANNGINIDDIKNKSIERNDKSYNKKVDIFKQKFLSNIEELDRNILYNMIMNDEDNIIEDIFDRLINNNLMTDHTLIAIFADHNFYVASSKNIINKGKDLEQVRTMTRAINASYHEYKQEIRNILKKYEDSVKPEKLDYSEEIKSIKEALIKENIVVDELTINQDIDGRKFIKVATNTCDDESGKLCYNSLILKAINNIFKESFILLIQSCGLRTDKKICEFTYCTSDRFKIDASKKQIKRSDKEKIGELFSDFRSTDNDLIYTFADGDESYLDEKSNDTAYNNSKVVNGIIEKIFDRESENTNFALASLKSTLKEADLKQIYADYNIIISNLFNGKVEVLDNNQSQIILKHKGDVSIINFDEINIDEEFTNLIISDDDILVLASKGVVESNIEDEAWIGRLLRDIHTDVPDGIANIILQEAKSNKPNKKSDLSVLVLKYSKI